MTPLPGRRAPMLEQIRIAGAEDFGALWRFYEDVCRAQEHDEYGSDWHLGDAAVRLFEYAL